MENEELYKLIGNNIRKNRKDQCLTIQDIANLTDTDWSFLARIETGNGIPSIATVNKIAKALNIGLEDIFKKQKNDNLIDKTVINLIESFSENDKKNIVKILKTIKLINQNNKSSI
ncbi:MAG: helix-turn-helix domain-containing protein [Endomicrobia bacterium]|nr:helix-turn-helix domain-containing protein [Endomicrobiia bacterium]